MALQAQFGGLAGCLPCGGSFAEEQMRALQSVAATANNGYHCHPGVVVSGAQSELTCNGSGGVLLSSRKRGREATNPLDQYVSSAAALLPIPSMQQASRAAGSAATTSTSGRMTLPSAQDALVLSELFRQQGAEIDALVRAECERLRAGVERARKRQCQELARAVAEAVARETEAALDAARRRAAELEARLRQVAAESQAWCGLARGHEAVAAELRTTLDGLLLRGDAAAPAVEGFGEADGKADDDAQSCCFEANRDAQASPAAGKWACKACGDGEASVLLLPCRHLCLCKACEPRVDACPVCLAVKNASIHIAAN